MTTNLQNIFDAIVGYNGAAAIDGWGTMSEDELSDAADAQAENYYEPIIGKEATRIAKAVIQYRDSDNSNKTHYIRETLAN